MGEREVVGHREGVGEVEGLALEEGQGEGEQLDPVTVGFSLAVIAVVFVSRRMAVGQPAGSPSPRA